ncbi:MAG: endonuclease III [Candidatus Aenigmarchaeota archaeon]|nr:endonuclease III [Candidatus Aenigmarchaeota archaeon]
MDKKAVKVLESLKEIYPVAKYMLRAKNPLQILIATILSAQTTDRQVNKVLPSLFSEFKTAEEFADSPLAKIEGKIKSIGLYRTKAKNIKAACTIIQQKYRGQVPDSMDKLLELPGVGRKTANVVLPNAFGKIEGICVDTHVARLAFRLGWTQNRDRNKIEKDLIGLLPKEWWHKATYLLIEHGRAVCKAPVPSCSRCGISGLCPRNGVEKWK